MLIYLGNKLSIHGNTPSSIETLGRLLASRYNVKFFSSKRNQIIRWLDMMSGIWRHRETVTVILIDTYSSRGFYYAIGAAVICNFYSIPYVPILRGGNLNRRLENNPQLCKIVFKRAHLLVAPSDHMKKVFNDHGYDQVKSIFNSIQLEDYLFNKRTSVQPSLLWVRSFHRVYNPIMAIDVLKKLRENYPHARLCMVGPDKDGSLQECKDYAKELGLTDQILFTGVLPKQEWHQLSNSYDIFINTTNTDNTPVSVIEAMALGMPVVSTSVGGIPYLIQDKVNGLLVDSGDVEGMCRKIIELTEDQNLAHSLSVAARSSVEEFDWMVVKEKWFEVLDSFEEPRCIQ